MLFRSHAASSDEYSMQVDETSKRTRVLGELWEKGVLCDEVQIAGRRSKERVWAWGWGGAPGWCPWKQRRQ